MAENPARPHVCSFGAIMSSEAERVAVKETAKRASKAETAKAKVTTKATAKATAKAKAKAKCTTSGGDIPRKLPHPSLGFLNAVYATGKSYLPAPGDDAKLHLFLEVREKHTCDHAKVCAQIMRHSVKHNLTKPDAIAY
eukprot:9476258-Pyramimonas_sp.AAC.2